MFGTRGDTARCWCQGSTMAPGESRRSVPWAVRDEDEAGFCKRGISPAPAAAAVDF